MACSPPVTRSAGFIFLDYIHTSQGLPHRTHVRLNSVTDPLDPIIMFTEADTWSAILQDVLPANVSIVGWGTQNIDGVGLLQVAFSSAKVGQHSTAAGAEDYKARTVTLTGRGIPGTPTACKGPTVSRIFVADAFNFQPGQRFVSFGVDAALDALRDFYETNSVLWFDFYGQKGIVRTTYPTHFHAYIQDRFGQ